MTRHRSPRGRGAAQDWQDRQDARERRTSGHQSRYSSAIPTPPTVPTAVPRRGGRHRSPTRSALGRGMVAAGVSGGALVVVGTALPTFALVGQEVPDTGGTLALSSPVTDGDTSSAVTPARSSGEGPVGAASADLIKAVDRERRAAEERATEAREAAERAATEAREAAERERLASLDCGVSDSYDGVADAVQRVGNAMECVFPGHDVLGVGSRGNASDHPGGYALDFMTDSGSSSGDAIANCVMDNADALGVKYAIWDRRINSGSGWSRMEDRGGRTANHEDHVHISFERGASPDISALRSCGSGGSGSDERA